MCENEQTVAVSIIIVNYNTKDFTRNCLKSIFEQTKDISFEVLVSDNGSTDGSIEMIKSEFPQVILIENNANLGFGAANNRALENTKGRYIFFLNSDTVLQNNALKFFFDYWENSLEKDKIGALGCYLKKDEKIIHSYAEYPSFKNISYTLFRDYLSAVFGGLKRYRKKTYKDPLQFEDIIDKKVSGYITGADLFVKRTENLKFDERFFMYFEESDLQFNLYYKNNLTSYVLSSPAILHFEGGSDNSGQSFKYSFCKKSSIYYWLSCIKYFRKNLSSHKFSIAILKFVVFLVWISPANIKKTRFYIKELLSI